MPTIVFAGGGPSQLPVKYHTVIELPQRKTGSLKFRRSPLGWKSLFRGRPAKPHQRKGSEPIDIGLTVSLVGGDWKVDDRVD